MEIASANQACSCSAAICARLVGLNAQFAKTKRTCPIARHAMMAPTSSQSKDTAYAKEAIS
jgi:hypothetical protein